MDRLQMKLGDSQSKICPISFTGKLIKGQIIDISL